MPADVLAVLDDLGVQDVYVVGGPAAVSDAVVNAVGAGGREVSRIAGEDRYETAYLLATTAADLAERPSHRILLVRGDGLADALSAAPYAASTGVPLLLTASDHLPEATGWALEEILGETGGDVLAVGGPKAISDDVLVETREHTNGFFNLYRWDGADRYATSVRVAQQMLPERSRPLTAVGLANGVSLVDALPGSVLLAQHGAPVLLTQPTALGADVGTFLGGQRDTLTTGFVLGGTASVPATVVTEARQTAIAPPVRIVNAVTTDTTLVVEPEQRADYRFTVHLAPSVPGDDDGFGYEFPGATWPAGAREVAFAPDAGSSAMTIPGLDPGIRYDVWLTRTIGDLPPTTTATSVLTNYSPPVIYAVRADADGVHVDVDAPPADGNLYVYLTTAATNPDGTYRAPQAPIYDPTGLIQHVPLELNGWVQGSAGVTRVTMAFPGVVPGEAYEVWASTGTLEPLYIGDVGRRSTWSYWNSAENASQTRWVPTPIAPSVVVPAG